MNAPSTVRSTPPRRAVRRLALARLVSITGGSAAYTALTFSIFERTDSYAWLAASLLVTFGVNGLLGPFAGVLGDRFDRQRVMVVSDIAGAAAFAGLALVEDPAAILAVAFCSAVAETPFWSASAAAIPNMVEPKDLTWANSLVAAGRNAGIMIGPALGGALLAATGPNLVYILNAATFLASAVVVLSIRATFADPARADEDTPGVVGRLVAGVRFLVHERVLRRITLGWVTFVLGMGVAMVGDAPLARLFGAGEVGYGLLIAAWGGGSVLGSLLGRFLRAYHEARALVWGTVFVAVMTLGIATSPSFVLVLALSIPMGAGDALSLVAEQGIRQRRTPDGVRSRVMAASDAAWHLALAVAYVLASPALEAVGPRGAYAIGAASALLAAVVMWPVLRLHRVPTGAGAVPVEGTPMETVISRG